MRITTPFNCTIVFAEADTALKYPPLYWCQWKIVEGLSSEIARRCLLDLMSVAFVQAPDIDFRFRDGSPYLLPEIDEVFDDPDMRWLSGYLECDESGLYPRRRSSRVERLRLINLYLKLAFPQCRHLLSAR